MIMFGNNIQSAADELRKVQEEYLYNSLRNPKPQIDAKIRQLRVAYQIDPKQYAIQKRTLPYVVCGIFNPPYRRKENFAFTESFIIDIDHIGSKELSLADIRKKIISDSRVMMCFMSPSEDGLKVMFHLKDRCYDAGIFSVFYKEFLRQFSQSYGLEQVADTRTSDVTRACFVSVDPDAYYNLLADPVSLSDFVDTENPSALFYLKQQQEKAAKETGHSELPQSDVSGEPDKDVMARIKQCLNRDKKIPTEKPVFVPQQLMEIVEELKIYIQDTGLVVTDIQSIQYGKKIHIKMGRKEAEINLFFGKKGFSVVKSPKCGTDGELNDICADLIQAFIYNL